MAAPSNTAYDINLRRLANQSALRNCTIVEEIHRPPTGALIELRMDAARRGGGGVCVEGIAAAL